MPRASLRQDLEILASAAVLVLVFVIWRHPVFVFQAPRLTVVAIAVGCLVVLVGRIPLHAWGYWLAGSATLAWSLAPGNTVVYQLWEVAFLAAVAAGSWRLGFWILNLVLLGNGLLNALALNAFGLQRYLSGSIHYVLGAQALVVLPLALGFWFRTDRLVTRLGLTTLLVLSSYAALISGSRAVYLPLTIILVLGTYRLIREGHRWYAVLGLLAAVAGVLVIGDRSMPGQPLATALGSKGTVAVQVEATGSHGVATQRLRFWDQTFAIALDRPMGSGTGSYQAVIHAYQKYPMLWSNSPHNVFVETVATGGWVRLALLLILIGWPMLRGWRGDDWTYALGAFGIWTTMAFDVTSYYPSFVMLAFATLGPLYHSSRAQRPVLVAATSEATWWQRLAVWLTVLACSLMVVLAMWWYIPCSGPMCSVRRYLGFQPKVESALAAAGPVERSKLLQAASRLYPKSLWVVREEQRYATGPDERLRLAREVATRFSLQSPKNFLDWANAAIAVGAKSEALRAVTQGLEVFQPDAYPYGEVRITHEAYQQWVEDAEALKRRLTE